jgi:hypothetical protein
MFCDRCGANLGAGTQFCPSCGKAFGTAMEVRRGIVGHVKALGILWLIHAAFSLLPGLVLLTVSRNVFWPPDVPPFALNFLPLIGGFFIFGGAFSTLVGIGLLMRQSWARVAALIVGGISLLSIPFGTALGIYTLWVLLPSDHEEEYRALTNAA